MNNYIPEEYDKIIGDLKPIIDKYNLDQVMVSGLVRGIIEVEQQPVLPVSRVWKSKNGNSYTVKPSNIKVNLVFALGNAFRLKTIFSQKDVWLILAIIYLIADLYTNATEKVDEISSIVLLAVYRMQKGDAERILNYAKEIQPKDSGALLEAKSCVEALNNLEELRCIELVDGEYRVCESIDSSLYSYDREC